jgi:hypothetical protein
MKNFRVLSVSENQENVSLQTINEKGKKQEFSNFHKVYIGAGNIETFRILANSKIVSKEVLNKDSGTFFVPFFLSPRYPKPEKFMNTLSQAFVRYESSNSGAIQLQIYDYSEGLISRARAALPFGGRLPTTLLRLLLARIFVGIGYLDSQESSSIRMQLDSDGNVCLDAVHQHINSQKKLVVQKFRQTGKTFRQMGLRPIISLIQYALPGEGVHSGGWLPMGKACDLEGRPMGYKNIHVVDSSIFPTIPPGAITFTVMANAVRITSRIEQ